MQTFNTARPAVPHVDDVIRIERTAYPRRPPAGDSLQFGQVFSDHMFRMEFDDGRWHSPRVVPYSTLSLDPAAAVLHYGQAVFEGLKAFRGFDSRIRIFRPDAHARRLQASCARLCMPSPDPEMVVSSFEALVRTDGDWVPPQAGTALYLRPTLVATEAFLGVRPATRYAYYVIATPVGSYFDGSDPLRIWVDREHVRAFPGGVGAAKAAGNYAGSFRAAEQARARGYAQVLWLDGRERRYIDEVGTMNLMVRIGDEVLTPPLEGTILPGITRDSVLSILRRQGVAVRERRIALDEILEAARSGSLREIWGTGTAAAILPVAGLGWEGGGITVNEGRPGELATMLLGRLTAIQRGELPDDEGWTFEVR